ncbi:MAG: ATP-binding cassette domain-containing protein [Verrucomicrobiales bacterium]
MRLRFDKVSYHYPGQKTRVFDQADFTFQPGLTILKGYSGCGKSTLLRLAAGLLKPQSGRITADTPHRPGSVRFLREEVGFVFQSLNLLPLASIKRNLSLAAFIARQPQAEALTWLDTLGISELAKRRPAALSGGQKQRAALARALAKKPNLLLLDEPTSGLDDHNTDIISHVLKHKLPVGTTCLIATHDSRLLSLTNEIIDFDTSLPA